MGWSPGLILCGVVVPALVAACMDGDAASCRPETSPEEDKVVCSKRGTFAYSERFDGRTGVEGHSWNNPAVAASIVAHYELTGGTVSLRLRDGHDDPAGPIYSFEARDDDHSVQPREERTPDAASGPWTVRLEFDRATGWMSLSVSSED